MFERYFSHELKEGEELHAMIRKHWIVLTVPLVKAVISTAIALLVARYFLRTEWLSLIWILWMLVTLSYILYRIFLWYLDSFIITSHRVIDIDQTGLFHRQVSETPIDRIQDITYRIAGPMQTLFNVGTVMVQTGGATDTIEMSYVSQPQHMQEYLFDLLKKTRGTQPSTKQHMSAEELVELIQSMKLKNDDRPPDPSEPGTVPREPRLM